MYACVHQARPHVSSTVCSQRWASTQSSPATPWDWTPSSSACSSKSRDFYRNISRSQDLQEGPEIIKGKPTCQKVECMLRFPVKENADVMNCIISNEWYEGRRAMVCYCCYSWHIWFTFSAWSLWNSGSITSTHMKVKRHPSLNIQIGVWCLQVLLLLNLVLISFLSCFTPFRYYSSTLQPVGFPSPVTGGLPTSFWGAPPSAAASVAPPLRPGSAVRTTPPPKGPGASAPQGAAVLCRPERRPVGSLHLPAHERMEHHRERNGQGLECRGEEREGRAETRGNVAEDGRSQVEKRWSRSEIKGEERGSNSWKHDSQAC